MILILISVNSPQVTRKKFLIDIDVVSASIITIEVYLSLALALNRGYKWVVYLGTVIRNPGGRKV